MVDISWALLLIIEHSFLGDFSRLFVLSLNQILDLGLREFQASTLVALSSHWNKR